MIAKERLNEAIAKVMAAGNPYIDRSTMFYKDRSLLYLYGGTVLTAEEINTAYRNTVKHDIEAGYKERMVGYYDKWYRYTRADSGRAYDEGVRIATESEKAPAEYHIIECMA